MTTLHSLQLRTSTGFHFTQKWKRRLESSLLTVYTKMFFWFPFFSLFTFNDRNPQFLVTLCITIRDETMQFLTRIRFALVVQKIHFTLDDKFHFRGICIVMVTNILFTSLSANMLARAATLLVRKIGKKTEHQSWSKQRPLRC